MSDFDDDFDDDDFFDEPEEDQPKTYITKPKHKAEELKPLAKIKIKQIEKNYLEDSLERDASESLKFYNLRVQITNQLLNTYNQNQAILYGRLLANKYLTGVVYSSEIERELASLA